MCRLQILRFILTGMHYRLATSADITAIAQLHALSWQQAYRGMLDDDFLDNHVQENRQVAWQARLSVENPAQFVMVAADAVGLTGFVCLFLDVDPDYGALLDNLHVAPHRHGQGIGKTLMQHAMAWLAEQAPQSAMHLWVFANNEGAIRLYQRLGGVIEGEKIETNFGTQPVRALRIVWR